MDLSRVSRLDLISDDVDGLVKSTLFLIILSELGRVLSGSGNTLTIAEDAVVLVFIVPGKVAVIA